MSPFRTASGGRGLPAATVTEVVGELTRTDATAAAMLRDHVRVQDLLLAHGSVAQQEFVASEAVSGRRFAGAWAALASSDDGVGDAPGPDGHLRLLPRPAGGRLLMGYQHVPAHSAAADWAVFRVRDRGQDLLVLVPQDAPRLCFDVAERAVDGSEPPARALLNGVRVLDSWLISLARSDRGPAMAGSTFEAPAGCCREPAGAGAGAGARPRVRWHAAVISCAARGPGR